MVRIRTKKIIYSIVVSLATLLMAVVFYRKDGISNIKTVPIIQNNKNDIFYGETLYPEQIKATVKKYNKKYHINIFFAEADKDFLDILNTMEISNIPKAIFKYNEWHKYGFIFVKYNGLDYCICVDTIPTLSEYTKTLIMENDNLFIGWNSRRYRAIIFGENLQKAQKGCGSFTLAIFKQLLKNDAKYLFEALDVYNKYRSEDETQRDIEKKSCIRGVRFEYIKDTNFAPEIYKYSQNMSLQSEFDDRLIGNQRRKMKDYRMYFSNIKIDKNGKKKLFSTKVFQITQKYKDANLSKLVK